MMVSNVLRYPEALQYLIDSLSVLYPGATVTPYTSMSVLDDFGRFIVGEETSSAYLYIGYTTGGGGIQCGLPGVIKSYSWIGTNIMAGYYIKNFNCPFFFYGVRMKLPK